MKILHCCLACFYIDNYGYQENMLPKLHKRDGHDVSILASTETFVNDVELGYVEPRKYINEYGIPVTRVAYKKILTHFIARKVRSYKGVRKILEETGPDVILFHDPCAWDLLTVAKYKKNNSHMKLYVDCHTDANNSSKTFISRNLLHRLYYRTIVRRACRNIDKILYISLETKDFLNTMYGIPDEKMEFFPLGGIPLDDNDYITKRKKIRSALNLADEDILLVHSGKLDKLKRTAEILEALSKVISKKLRLVILGSFSDDIKSIVESMIQADSRVTFEGWKNAEEITEYLCAADMYVQPGSQSVTMQNAICCRCAVMLYPHRSHEPYLQGNGYFVKNVEDMVKYFRLIDDQPHLLGRMSEKSQKVAADLLDYRKLAARLYQ
jgi:glycosyltransferase involved in cell wall biosynthesis